MADDYPFIRQVHSPITEYQLRPLDPRCLVVQFDSPLSDNDFSRLSRFLKGYPKVPLRIYGHYRQTPDLSFLSQFPFLQGFQADVYQLTDLDGLAFLPDSLEFLGLGQTKRRLSLKPLARFKKLKDLFLVGHTKDFSIISELTDLVKLNLRSITLPNLSPLLPLRQLRSLALKLGGTKDLSLLPELNNLRYLELWMVKGLTDLGPVSQLHQLRYLFLQDLKQVTRLPSFTQLRKLERCTIENLKGLTELCSIAAAESLRELCVVNMPQIPVSGFECFKNHPTLREASVGLGSMRRNAEVTKMLGLPPVSNIKPIASYVYDD
ncbi:MAG: hypothetical protein ND895_25135 [Pyrinomonadaceae bacterium]|nr:hypothetical protein [Pyrinomonadaceae bacterium]